MKNVTKNTVMKIIIYQIVINRLATKYKYDQSQTIDLVEKIIELQKALPKSQISILKIEL
jgi:hypothetical protein